MPYMQINFPYKVVYLNNIILPKTNTYIIFIIVPANFKAKLTVTSEL